MANNIFDVIIIGGSYSGLSAGLTLGRSLRSTLIIDSGKPCNRQTPHSHNFLTQDRKTPQEISKIAREQVKKYSTIEFYDGLAINAWKTEVGIEVVTEKGDLFKGKKLIIATGMKDIFPKIKGFSDCWGISIIHCPYCHGYEFRNQKTGIWANDDHAFHMTPLVYNLTSNLSILTSGKANFSEDQSDKFKQNNINVIESEIIEIEHINGHVKTVIFDNGKKMDFDAIYAKLPVEQHSDIAESLGCVINEQGYITVDEYKKTTTKNVFACGDNTTYFRSISNAVFNGNIAGAIANMELSTEMF